MATIIKQALTQLYYFILGSLLLLLFIPIGVLVFVYNYFKHLPK